MSLPRRVAAAAHFSDVPLLLPKDGSKAESSFPPRMHKVSKIKTERSSGVRTEIRSATQSDERLTLWVGGGG